MVAKSIRSILLLALLALSVPSCAPSDTAVAEAIQETMAHWTSIPSQTPLPTYTPPPTVAIEITRIVVVTATHSPTPRFTSTITLTPTPTSPPTSTPTVTRTPNATQTAQAIALERMRRNKQDGFYLVNVDVAPGVWRSTGTGDSCYWATTTTTGNILDNHFGMAGGTAYISPTAFQVEFNGCGTWVFLSPP